MLRNRVLHGGGISVIIRINPNVESITVTINNEPMTITQSIILRIAVGSMVSWTTTVSANMIPQNGYGSVEYADKDITISPTAVTLADYEYEWNGEESVDLGLSFHVGTCNIGANSPEEDGGLYMWASVTDNSNTLNTNWNKCPYVKKYDPDTGTLTFSSYNSTGATLSTKDDIVYVTKDSDWRMPTASNLSTLISNTYQQVSTYKGKEGVIFISKINYRTIFIPYVAPRTNGSTDNIVRITSTGSLISCMYWSRTQSSTKNYMARSLDFRAKATNDYHLTGSCMLGDWCNREYALPVRGVKLYNL